MIAKEKRKKVAYFCMEYGINNNFRIYAGGLGILAGDILKAAHEFDYPIFGIGMLWLEGYTKQLIDENGRPYDKYPTNDYIYNHLEDTGVTVTVQVKGNDIKLKVWKMETDYMNPLYLLDSNLEENGKYDWITKRLYAWGEEERIAQEIALGIGGIRAIRALDLDVDVYHYNEGHAVFAGTEMINEKMEEGLNFDQALEAVRNQTVFTTHTPVKKGNEEHAHHILKDVGAYNGLTEEQMKQIGNDPFSNTVAGLRLAKISNGVAQLHGVTARKMWEHVDNRSPIKAITNGVHRKTWVDSRMFGAFEDGNDLLPVHQQLKSELINYVKDKTGSDLDANKLLIGFARRAAPYKRADLIFSKMNVIEPYLKDSKIQIIFSGKAHPLDDKGKDLVQRIVKLAEKYPNSVVFLEDYNMEIAKMMTRGVDVWLNNPRRPKEASGTSGMKSAMNGVLNMSILDGWWPEACQHGMNGWQFGDGYVGENQDQHDRDSLYRVLLNEVVPTYYDNKAKWEDMMNNSIESTYEEFSAEKMIENYYLKMYRKIR
ncbi:MAG TPA: alpha-glucan family phosphorylase [Halanaerobiales bacterium]|nr:alpha-glucan family phosphorylase [Halanaerobiales bacterium]